MMRRFIREVRHSMTFEGRLETGARAAYLQLDKLDKSILVCTFNGADEDMLMVFVRGEKAERANELLGPLLDQPRIWPFQGGKS